jgi:hypothetical protein
MSKIHRRFIERDRFKDRLLWQESIAVHATRSARPRADFPYFCCTNIGKLGLIRILPTRKVTLAMGQMRMDDHGLAVCVDEHMT